MTKKLTEPQKLRLQADRMEAEAEHVAAKPERSMCGECGRPIPWTKAQRAKVKKAGAKARKLRQAERLARESE